MLVTTTAIYGKVLELIKDVLQQHGMTHTVELSTATRVLIARGSEGVKCKIARERGIPCVTMAWVWLGRCCMDRLDEFDIGNSLLGLEVCGSSLTFEQRRQLQRVCGVYRATYNSSLTRNCALLIIPDVSNVSNNNEKIQFAKRNRIKIISYSYFMKRYGDIKMQLESRSAAYRRSSTVSTDVIVYFSPANLVTEGIRNLVARASVKYSPALTFLTTHVVLLGNTTEVFPLRHDIEFVSLAWLEHCMEKQEVVAEEGYRVAVEQRPVITFTGVPLEARVLLHSALETSGLPCLVQGEFILGVKVDETIKRFNTTHLVVERSALAKSSKVNALIRRMNKLRRRECLVVDVGWVRRSLEVGYWFDCSSFLMDIPQLSLPKKVSGHPNVTAAEVVEVRNLDGSGGGDNDKEKGDVKGEHVVVSQSYVSPGGTQSEISEPRSLDILIERLESKAGVLGVSSMRRSECDAEAFSNVNSSQNGHMRGSSREAKPQSLLLKSEHVEKIGTKIPVESQIIVYKYSDRYPSGAMQHDEPNEVLGKNITENEISNCCVAVDIVTDVNNGQKKSSSSPCCIMMAKLLMYTDENLVRLQSLGCVLATTMEECTHYVTGKPSKTEFFLCSLAAGKWVLAPSFIDETLREGRIACEELHEWSPQIAELGSFGNSVVNLVRGCQIQRMRSVRPFSSWSVILCCVTDLRTESFSRVLQSGGCNVVRPSTPSQLLDTLMGDPCALLGITAVLSDDNIWSVTQLGTIAALVPVLRLEYLAHCLCVDTPEPDQYVLLGNPLSRKRPRVLVS